MNNTNWRYLGEVGYEGDKVIITDSENFPKFFDPRSSLILLTEEDKKKTQKIVTITVKKQDAILGPPKKGIFIVLCHFESIEKNKKKAAITTIGIKIAL